MAVILSENYSGEEFLENYAIDPQSGLEISLDVDLKSNSSLIVDAINSRNINNLILKNALVNLMEKARKTDLDNQIKIISKDVWKKFINLKVANSNTTNEDLMNIANYGTNEIMAMLKRGGFS